MKRNRQDRRAFTLIELLLALVITAALAALTLTVMSSVLRLWQRAQDRFSTQAQARLALDLLARDLAAAVVRTDGRVWFAVDVLNSPDALARHGWAIGARMKPAGVPGEGAAETAGIAGARFGRSGVWLRFNTINLESRTTRNPLGSLPVVVAYQLARRPVSGTVSGGNPAAIRYALYRSAVAADVSWDVGPDVLAGGYDSASAGFAAARSARSVTNPSAEDALAANVVDFGVWLYVRQAGGRLTRVYPAMSDDASHQVRVRGDWPAVVDVMIRVLTDEGAVLLEQVESGANTITRPSAFADDAAWWWSIVEAHSQVSVRRIALEAELP